MLAEASLLLFDTRDILKLPPCPGLREGSLYILVWDADWIRSFDREAPSRSSFISFGTLWALLKFIELLILLWSTLAVILPSLPNVSNFLLEFWCSYFTGSAAIAEVNWFLIWLNSSLSFRIRSCFISSKSSPWSCTTLLISRILSSCFYFKVLILASLTETLLLSGRRCFISTGGSCISEGELSRWLSVVWPA